MSVEVIVSKTVFPSTKTDILMGPTKEALAIPHLYVPVDCDFTDELEFVSVKKIHIILSYWNSELKLAENRGLIVDILTTNKEEFVVMSDGERIRLDRIFKLQIL